MVRYPLSYPDTALGRLFAQFDRVPRAAMRLTQEGYAAGGYIQPVHGARLLHVELQFGIYMLLALLVFFMAYELRPPR